MRARANGRPAGVSLTYHVARRRPGVQGVDSWPWDGTSLYGLLTLSSYRLSPLLPTVFMPIRAQMHIYWCFKGFSAVAQTLTDRTDYKEHSTGDIAGFPIYVSHVRWFSKGTVRLMVRVWYCPQQGSVQCAWMCMDIITAERRVWEI